MLRRAGLRYWRVSNRPVRFLASNVGQFCASKKINTIVLVTGSVNLPVMLQCSEGRGEDGCGLVCYLCLGDLEVQE